MTFNGTTGITYPDASVQATGEGLAKAWVNFNGTFASSPFTLANGGIRAAFNVSSVTDNGVGSYTINFAQAMSNEHYCVVGMTNTASASTTNRPIGIASSGDASAPTLKTALAVRVSTGLTSLADMNNINIVVMN
jgi:hypothetical protein